MVASKWTNSLRSIVIFFFLCLSFYHILYMFFMNPYAFRLVVNTPRFRMRESYAVLAVLLSTPGSFVEWGHSNSRGRQCYEREKDGVYTHHFLSCNMACLFLGTRNSKKLGLLLIIKGCRLRRRAPYKLLFNLLPARLHSSVGRASHRYRGGHGF